LNLRQKDG